MRNNSPRAVGVNGGGVWQESDTKLEERPVCPWERSSSAPEEPLSRSFRSFKFVYSRLPPPPGPVDNRRATCSFYQDPNFYIHSLPGKCSHSRPRGLILTLSLQGGTLGADQSLCLLPCGK